MCMHFYLNIHISRLFNLRFIRTHPFKSILAKANPAEREQWSVVQLKAEHQENCRSGGKLGWIAIFLKVFSVSVSGDRVHVSGPDTAQIGSEVTLQCSSEESNPPAQIKWTVDGVQQFGTQKEVREENPSYWRVALGPKIQKSREKWSKSFSSIGHLGVTQPERGLTAYTEAVDYYSQSVSAAPGLLFGHMWLEANLT